MLYTLNNMLSYFGDKNLIKFDSISPKHNNLVIRKLQDQTMSKITICLAFVMVSLVALPALGSIAMGNTLTSESLNMNTSALVQNQTSSALGENMPNGQAQDATQLGNETTTDAQPTSIERLKMIVSVINTETPLAGNAHITVTFDNENEFKTGNKTITAEERIAFPMSIPYQSDAETANICAIVDGEENNCDSIALDPEEEGVLRVNLDLINFEDVEPVVSQDNNDEDE
ncbi:MAG: hypothetical protein H0U27_11150 [Nitrosopumilus sp.]|nr:hypothetical protein [Nitrosopumilus sp.]